MTTTIMEQNKKSDSKLRILPQKYKITFLTIQFNFICIVPNHNKHYLKALHIEGQDLTFFVEKPNSSHNEQHFVDCGEKKLPR